MSISRYAVEGGVFIWDWFGLECVSMVLMAMGLHHLTAFSERIVWPPGSPRITPMPKGMLRAGYIWIAAEYGVACKASLGPQLPQLPLN